MFWTRMFYCTITTLGYVMMALYTSNELLLFPGLVFLAWSGLAYLVINNVCVSIMGRFAGVSVIIFSGTFDASSATFLVLSKMTGTFGKGQN
ncbi:Oidioi.mRNA.OKI2018_I69.chr2.g5116.t1.cds [Oikopleura dioica]|uniref:Oidioi.mRNA.OKI2018_I69.chr2.g5116.t1.cds n=1 Tax=Oikopleura dioica TaxID=34765 RepID=A0ABN7T363_OIKDI|nr:Oidioi.mRNA.OKI2018_I69.chr2.g5116.t1.cds [Oikopleura dioica]